MSFITINPHRVEGTLSVSLRRAILQDSVCKSPTVHRTDAQCVVQDAVGPQVLWQNEGPSRTAVCVSQGKM